MSDSKLSKSQALASWIFQGLAAVVLFQTLFFKFSGAEESVYIFQQVGMEPWGRYLTAIVELIAGVLFLIPALSWAGALIALGVMAGAIGSHLTVLGIEVQNDGGLLFGLALLVTFSSLVVLFLRRARALEFWAKLRGRANRADSKS